MSPVLQSLKIASSRRIIGRWRRIAPAAAKVLAAIDDGKGSPRLWQKGGGFDHNVRNRDRFCKFVRYIHRNPVERELVERPEDCLWSSVRWWMGMREGEVECDPPPGDERAWMNWTGFK